MEIGDAVKADCKVEKIDSFYTVLKRAEMLTVNVEELNYLAKRLDSFDTGEAAQFQAMAHKLELLQLKDLINLTSCCQQATVITDFSDLAAIGRDHYMNLHGGSASVDELNALDGKKTARQLIESDSGTITPYGVVYDNGMKLSGKRQIRPQQKRHHGHADANEGSRGNDGYVPSGGRSAYGNIGGDQPPVAADPLKQRRRTA